MYLGSVVYISQHKLLTSIGTNECEINFYETGYSFYEFEYECCR